MITLKEIAGYLPYNLELQYVDTFTSRKRKALLVSSGIGEIETRYKRKINGISGDIISWQGHNNVSQMQVKPLLYPLSMLTQEIEHNGEKIIPILELAKTSDNYYNWEYNKKTCHFNCVVYKKESDTYRFSVNTDGKKIYSFNTTLNGSFIQTNNPHLIIEKLQELHFDVHGLIERGLAIDKSKI